MPWSPLDQRPSRDARPPLAKVHEAPRIRLEVELPRLLGDQEGGRDDGQVAELSRMVAPRAWQPLQRSVLPERAGRRPASRKRRHCQGGRGRRQWKQPPPRGLPPARCLGFLYDVDPARPVKVARSWKAFSRAVSERTVSETAEGLAGACGVENVLQRLASNDHRRQGARSLGNPIVCSRKVMGSCESAQLFCHLDACNTYP